MAVLLSVFPLQSCGASNLHTRRGISATSQNKASSHRADLGTTLALPQLRPACLCNTMRHPTLLSVDQANITSTAGFIIVQPDNADPLQLVCSQQAGDLQTATLCGLGCLGAWMCS